jgi:hypothetical protein
LAKIAENCDHNIDTPVHVKRQLNPRILIVDVSAANEFFHVRFAVEAVLSWGGLARLKKERGSMLWYGK